MENCINKTLMVVSAQMHAHAHALIAKHNPNIIYKAKRIS